MDLQTIRRKTAYSDSNVAKLKADTRTWLRSLHDRYSIACTLTLKQTIAEHTAKGTYKRQITVNDAKNTAQHFIKQLNKEVFKNSAKRHNKTLHYIVVCEGERSYKRLHLHFAIGGIATDRLKEMNRYINNAKQYVQNIDKEFKADIADSNWMDYITKELGSKDTENIFWDLMV
jgi:phenylalanyl-tRNA synthetase alpha subunit